PALDHGYTRGAGNVWLAAGAQRTVVAPCILTRIQERCRTRPPAWIEPVATVRKGTHDSTLARKPTNSSGPAAGRFPAGTSAPRLVVSAGEAVAVAASPPPAPPDAEEAAAPVRVQGG